MAINRLNNPTMTVTPGIETTSLDPVLTDWTTAAYPGDASAQNTYYLRVIGRGVLTLTVRTPSLTKTYTVKLNPDSVINLNLDLDMQPAVIATAEISDVQTASGRFIAFDVDPTAEDRLDIEITASGQIDELTHRVTSFNRSSGTGSAQILVPGRGHYSFSQSGFLFV